MPPLPQPTEGRDPNLPEVRLDVRVGTGRANGYDLSQGEFLIGGAEGCDIRLPGAHLPPVIAQFFRAPQGLHFRRVAPAFPILLNGQAFAGSEVQRLEAGDRLAIGAADIVVNLSGRGHIRPQFHNLARPNLRLVPSFESAPESAPAPKPSYDRERAELDRYRQQIQEQAQELEADRVAWYRRRQEVEAEVKQIRESAAVGTRQVDREAWMQKREADLAQREQELSQVRQELTEIRQTLFEQYRERRDQVEQLQQAVSGATNSFQHRQDQSEQEWKRRRAELDAEAGRMQDYVRGEIDRRAGELEGDYRRRRMELELQYESRLREQDEQSLNRRMRFEEELRTFEPRLADLHSQREQLSAAFLELETQKVQLTAMCDGVARERSALDAERAWQDQRRSEREELHAAREAEIDRQEELLQQDRQAFEIEQQKLSDGLLRLDRWQASVEERQAQVDRRAAEVDLRWQQLAREAKELEDHTRLFDAENLQRQADGERLKAREAELESRAEKLNERAAQLEAQQATLAVFRSRLDRQEDEMHREAAKLTSDRVRLDAAHRDLDERLRDAEHLRATLGSYHLTQADAERSLVEQRRLLEANLAEIHQQQANAAAEVERLVRKEQDLDLRSADIAEQTAVLKAKTAQVHELQQRLEADRTAIHSRESTIVDVDLARGAFQEQLRKRSEELAQRSRELDALVGQATQDRAAIEKLRAELAHEKQRAEQTIGESKQHLGDRDAEQQRLQSQLSEREAAMERQIERLRETGRSVAAGRKELFTAKQTWQEEQATLVERTLQAQRELDAFRQRALEDMERLRQQAPQLGDRAEETLQKLSGAREVLKGQLSELHHYAEETRNALDGLRTDLRAESERLRSREAELEKSRNDHRLAVSEYRAQVLEWQAKIGQLRSELEKGETRLDRKQAELEEASKKTDETAIQLAQRLERLRIDEGELGERRGQIERHLSDMREWYRRKLRDLAAERSDSDVEAPMPRLAVHASNELELDPGDRHLGELLRKLELVEPETLNSLWAEANRQRRTLRQVLLASGAVTLYQLALIEAGNVDALMIGRFRVVDRVRVTPREAIYRVFDPQRGGTSLLRVLGEAEMHDATHPDEYRQRFAAARDAGHANLPRIFEVLEIDGRPAAVQEALAGLPGSDWPTTCSVPGVWLRLAREAALGVDAAHQAGLIHGRLTTDSFVLVSPGQLKVAGFADPYWLTSGLAASFHPTAETDLRALGQALTMWSQAGGKKRAKGSKGFPDSLLAVVRKLEADAGGEGYRSAAELLHDLEALEKNHPLPSEAWADLVRAVEANASEFAVKKAG